MFKYNNNSSFSFTISHNLKRHLLSSYTSHFTSLSLASFYSHENSCVCFLHQTFRGLMTQALDSQTVFFFNLLYSPRWTQPVLEFFYLKNYCYSITVVLILPLYLPLPSPLLTPTVNSYTIVHAHGPFIHALWQVCFKNSLYFNFTSLARHPPWSIQFVSCYFYLNNNRYFKLHMTSKQCRIHYFPVSVFLDSSLPLIPHTQFINKSF